LRKFKRKKKRYRGQPADVTGCISCNSKIKVKVKVKVKVKFTLEQATKAQRGIEV
jgi:uncharacterized protein YlaI